MIIWFLFCLVVGNNGQNVTPPSLVTDLPMLPRTGIPSQPSLPMLPSISTGNFSQLYEAEVDKHIERPCEIIDVFCIRRYFVEHSQCKKTYGPVPDPLYRTKSTGNFANSNLTITADNVFYYGLNGRIDEFFINEETDNLVLAVEFRNVQFRSDYNYFRYYRRAKEPVVTLDFLYANFTSIVVTIIIPDLKNLQLQNSEVFTYVNDLGPRLAIGPNAFVSSDPTVIAAAAQYLANIPIDVREFFLTDGTFFIASFIQYNICDFGLKIV